MRFPEAKAKAVAFSYDGGYCPRPAAIAFHLKFLFSYTVINPAPEARKEGIHENCYSKAAQIYRSGDKKAFV